MRFISIYRPAQRTTHPPTGEQMQAMGAFMQEAVGAGVLLATEGFGPSTSTDAIARFKAGKFTVTDGPFTEAKEVIGGFAIMQCRTREEMLEWTRRFMAIAGEGECELHQL